MKNAQNLIFTFLIISICVCSSCNTSGVPSFNVSNIEGMIPVYEFDLAIAKNEPQEIINRGKIISYSHYILVTDVGSGIHVINNEDPSSPKNQFFISIKENTDMVIKNDILFVDNGPHLIGLDFLKDQLQIVSTVENVFLSKGFEKYPVQNNVYYQCPDPSKGEVLAWKKGIIENPDCYKRSEL